MRIRRNRQPVTPITFRVGQPPQAPKPASPSFWQTAILGALLVATIVTIWLGESRTDTGSTPASTTSQTTTP